MNEFESAILWCAVQATVVAGLGLMASEWLGRRSAATAAIVATSAAATILAVTLLAAAPRGVVSVDAWFTGTVARSSAGGANAIDAGSQDSASAHAESASPAVSIADLQAGLRRLFASAELRVEERSGAFRLAILAVVASAGVGLARLAVALRDVRRVLAESLPVGCPHLRTLFANMVEAAGPSRRPDLRESAELASPATCGWRRAVVVLPAERSDWTDAQLRAALAHELAHVARGDFVWRLAASVAAAIYFWHPLVHLLARRAALMQELAADRLAAAAAGGSATYLRAISELALRWDDSSRRRAAPVVLPALSSNLMRRIAVLRSKDGNEVSCRGRVLAAAAAGLIALVGVATMALGRAAETTPAASAARTQFARPPLDTAVFGHAEQGLFVVRLHELSQQPAFAEVFQLVSHEIRQSWPQFFPGAAAPDIRFDAIEFVAGAPTMKVKSKTGDGDDQRGQFMVGCGELVARFRSDVDWQSWIRAHLPGAEFAETDGLAYVHLPPIAAMGPLRMYLAARDAKTLVATGNFDRLKQLAAGPDPKPADVTAAWTQLEGGLATGLFAAPEIGAGLDLTANAEVADGSRTREEAAVMAAANVVVGAMSTDVRHVGVGFDLDPATNQIAIRLRLACEDAKSAEQLRAAIEALLPIAKVGLVASLNAEPRGPNGEPVHASVTPESEQFDREGHAFWMGLVENCRLECVPQESGAVHVCMTSTAPFVSRLVHSEQLAERTDAPAERK
jgi:beta-lactamase regulating signal transducer with metallopeptidase domain